MDIKKILRDAKRFLMGTIGQDNDDEDSDEQLRDKDKEALIQEMLEYDQVSAESLEHYQTVVKIVDKILTNQGLTTQELEYLQDLKHTKGAFSRAGLDLSQVQVVSDPQTGAQIPVTRGQAVNNPADNVVKLDFNKKRGKNQDKGRDR